MTSTNANDNPGSDAEGAVDPATVASPRTAAADLPPVNEGTADLSDHRRPLVRAARFGALALAVITVVSLIGWGVARGMPGVWGVVVGAVIGGGFVLVTVGVTLATSRTDATTTMTVMMGSWLVKIVVLLIVLGVLRSMDFYDKAAFVTTLLLAMVATLGTETAGVVTTRTTSVGR
ncbi:hypothetical protein CBOVI_03940 [Corynebacterium bovis DSM 20582 = CIP 54.80]|uniref:Ca2+/Na+ antiporter n=1 Tax=Corynebacterium bovis DSM 20582 = CIP 54.80 TaxID=927655 RepID=A0A8H9Y979_9CORY|nr:Ca2+/Na+ antiporter [Corynebacterium bovis DSM 20582 = CIP 54.80]WJY77319.1 hypothetical protein CBOVI_03940 [Corynebacterium bovis DSM 20582 = CIP 54.80]